MTREKFNRCAWLAARELQAMKADKRDRDEPPKRLREAIEEGLTLPPGDGRPLFELLKEQLLDK